MLGRTGVPKELSEPKALLKRLWVTVSVPSQETPPPSPATLPLRVEWVTATAPDSQLAIPPPLKVEAELPLSVELVTATVPPQLAMPPPACSATPMAVFPL